MWENNAMRLFHCWPFVSPIQSSVATIGAFDGAHLGHQKILNHLKTLAKKNHLATSVISFEPLPKEYFSGTTAAPKRLQSFAEKFLFLKSQGIDQFICLRFHPALTDLSADDFIEQILVARLKIKILIVGEDFRFGKRRLGDVALLKKYAARGLFELIIEPLVVECGEKIGSSLVRNLLAVGKFAEAARLLNYPYVINGKVIHGEKRGRLLDFPTANIQLNRRSSPLYGVYAIKMTLPSGELFNGVANMGYRPTVDKESLRLSLEVFLFTEKGLNLYGQRVQVEFLYKIRDEKKFTSLAALKAQIDEDVQVAKRWFRAVTPAKGGVTTS